MFHQPLRQTEGLLRSIADVLGIDIAIPDHTTLTRRGGGLTILLKRLDRAEPLHLLVDSTGLKIYGEGEWLDQKQGIRSRRRWRKLHLGIDALTHEIVASQLTPDDVGDVSEMPGLLDQIDAEIASMTADDAYDGEAVCDALAERHPEAVVIIPPRATAVPNGSTTTQRGRILPRLKHMDAWIGSVVQATIAGAWSKLQCIATRPLSAGNFAPELYPVSGPRRKLGATCSTG